MNHLHEIIQQNVAGWRAAGYPCDDYPAIAEILDYARLPGGETLRFLRWPQLRALETYWYLRLVERTPHIFDLYKRYYPKPLDLLSALGLDREEIKDFVLNAGLDALWEHIRTDDDFVKAHKLESVRETLTLDYPSYIFALAMGAGKTILIGAIEDFISPTIVERLEMDTPLFRAKIPDWRAMVDVVMIDTTYAGDVFNIDLSDVPERKDDLVRGHYELDAPDGPATVAVKIIDMLGEEVLAVEEM